MTTMHSPISFIGGDDWEISATLQDENGDPYDLTSAEILWTLVDSNGQRFIEDGDYTVSVTDPVAGTCKIFVPAAKTTTFVAGRYSDALRIVIGGITSTLSTGTVQVVTDPWRMVTQPAALTVVARRA